MDILEEANDSDDPYVSRKFLRNCALVCRGWSFLSQKLLFRDVSLRSEAAYEAFRLAVDGSSHRGHILGEYVVRLRVMIDPKHPSCLTHASFAQAVVSCPNLYELDIAVYGCETPRRNTYGYYHIPPPNRVDFDKKTIHVLKSGPAITSLRFSNWSLHHHLLSQLLEVWHSLKFLSINGTAVSLPPLSLPSPLFALEQLHMNIQTPPAAEFMSWLLNNSASTLRVLNFEREPSAALLNSILDVHEQTLQSLGLPACSSLEHVQAIQRCRNLKELKLDIPAPAAHALFRQLSRTIEHLALALGQGMTLGSMLDSAELHTSGLRTVSVLLWDGSEHSSQLLVLKSACARRGIELRTTYNVRVFRRKLVSACTLEFSFFDRMCV